MDTWRGNCDKASINIITIQFQNSLRTDQHAPYRRPSRPLTTLPPPPRATPPPPSRPLPLDTALKADSQ